MERAQDLASAMAHLRQIHPSKTLPQSTLVAFFLVVVLAEEVVTGSARGLMIALGMTAGFGFYAIVIYRVIRVTPLRNSLLLTAGTLLTLFVEYAVWLGLVPPLGSRSWIGWFVWVLLVAGAIAAMVLASQ